jgi:hypothetical protein
VNTRIEIGFQPDSLNEIVGNKLEHVFKGPATATEITYV